MTTETLYELADLRDIIDAQLEATEGELTDELAAALDAWEGAFKDKVERIAMYVSAQDRLNEAARAEVRALQEKCATRDRRSEWLKQYLQAQLERVGATKVEGAIKTVALQSNPPRVEPVTPIEEADLRNIATWAPSLIRHEESWSLDKKAILEAHKAGTLDAEVAKRVRVVQTKGVRIR